MTTITENTTIKKAPAKKTPKKDISSMLDKGFTEESIEATEVTKVDELEESLKSYKIRLDSMHSKNESLQSKLDVINTDNVQLVVPQGLIAKSVNDSVSKVHNNYLETIKEGQELLDMLEANDVKSAIDTIKDYKDRLVDVEDRINDLKDDFVRTDDLEYEIESYTSYYVDEGDIERMIDNAIDNINQDNDYVEMNDFRHDCKILEDKISILENRQRHHNKGLLSKLYAFIKRLFGYNFNSKVGV